MDMTNTIITPIGMWRLPTLTGEEILIAVFLLLAVAVAAMLAGLFAARKFKANKWKTALTFAGIAIMVTALLLCFFGLAVGTLRGALLCLVLVYCSFSDLKSREVDDYLHLMVLLTAFIGTEIAGIPQMCLSAILLTLPTMLVCILCQGRTIGGADIKLTAACGFLLGLWKGSFGLTIGLLLGIIVNFIVQLKKDKGASFPLVPYLAAGFMAAYFI